MSHTILSLITERFDTRAVVFGGCLININGETRECVVSKDNAHFISPTYTVNDKDSQEELCTFRPYHLWGGPVFYEIEGVSQSGGSASLIVPSDDLLRQDGDEDEGEGAEECAAED